ncbi:threonine synthase [Actinopolymorpha pittospori]
MAEMPRPWRGVVEEYRSWLPVGPETPVITLGEGGTPLVTSGWLSELTGCDVRIKVEGTNPTGSFKDRGMTVAVSKAAEAGVKLVVCASTGNTSASAAAYASRAGMQPVVLVPEGRIAQGKLAQAIVHGARLVQVRGNFDDCLKLARGLAEEYPVVLVNSANRDGFRLAGQKTAAFEVVDVLGDAPDLHLLPVGNAGNITAYWAGYGEYAAAGHATRRPRMWGFQAAGAAPIVAGAPIEDPETVATAIRVGNPARWEEAVAALEESSGRIDAIPDEEILAAQARLAARDGIFVEPASAVGVAGLLRSHAAGLVDPGQRVVITVTGHGLKDVDTALAAAGDLVKLVVPPEPDAAARALELR